MGGGEGRGASSRLRKAARNMILAAANACGSFSRRRALVDPVVFDHTTSDSISGSSAVSPRKIRNMCEEEEAEEEEDVGEEFESSSMSTALPTAKVLPNPQDKEDS